MTAKTATPEAMALAKVAETHRSVGRYSNAIEAFNRLLTLEPKWSWALAHRGAAKSALGDLKGAIVDLDAATKLQSEYTWAWSQIGEAYRLQAKRYFDRALAQREFKENIENSIKAFRNALGPDANSNSWAHAHLGATYALNYLQYKTLPEAQGDFEESGRLGVSHFERACVNNPTYAWALVFQAYLLALMGEHDQARVKLESGLLYDSNHRLFVLRGICELLSYQSKPDDAINVAWMALKNDPEDLASRYVVARDLKGQGDPNARAAIEDMYWRLAEAQSHIDTMREGLREIAPEWAVAIPSNYLGSEALGLSHLDPALKLKKSKK